MSYIPSFMWCVSRIARRVHYKTKISGANNADREIFIFPVQLTTRRIDTLTRLIHTLAIICVTMYIRYIHT